MHSFCKNIAKIYINLPVPNKFRRPFLLALNTEYSIFIKQNKKIIIVKQLKTVNLFLFKSSYEMCSNQMSSGLMSVHLIQWTNQMSTGHFNMSIGHLAEVLDINLFFKLARCGYILRVTSQAS
jgi:hypothetical protein